jgi:hypothetical protein
VKGLAVEDECETRAIDRAEAADLVLECSDFPKLGGREGRICEVLWPRVGCLSEQE